MNELEAKLEDAAAAVSAPLSMESMDEFENSLADMNPDGVDEFDETMDYEKFIVLNKKELSNFCRIVEPLTKAAVDEYGKSILLKSIDDDVVELTYKNAPFLVSVKMENKSRKRLTKPVAISLVVLKKITTAAYASLILVEEQNASGEDNLFLSLGESLIPVETKPLRDANYDFVQKTTSKTLDKELSSYAFRKVGAILSASDKQQEKSIIIKDNNALFNTAFFVASIPSPFGETEDFIIYNAVSNLLSIVAEVSKSVLKYDLYQDDESALLAVSCDGKIYCEVPIGKTERVEEFVSPMAEKALLFDANITIMNDTLLRIISIVKVLDYMSDIVTLEFTNEQLIVTISTQNQLQHTPYKFKIIEGKPKVLGVMKVNVDVIKTYLEITGSNVKYAYTDEGLGITNEKGRFMIRKN